MKGAPRSEQYDDIYFSVEDGLAETDYVFLKGNNLPEAWQDKDSYVIAETGFGTGLNFLSAWKLFEETSKPHQTLDFISVEKYPLSASQLKEMLEPWEDYFGERLERLCDLYPIRIAGFHRIKINYQITLTLIFDDIKEAFPLVDALVDCWFLDGFTPAKNPDMWSPEVFAQMARLSTQGTSFATFTAAGDVKRGLTEAGFCVTKQKGFGRKRDMIAGYFLKGEARRNYNRPKRIAIIGGGLAGTTCAYVLKQYGFDPVIYEASSHIATEASGNPLGLYNPRFSKLRDPFSNYFTSSYAQFIRMAIEAGDRVEYNPCGALHLINSEDKALRLESAKANWGWHEDHMQLLDAPQASEIAGIELNEGALYLPESGSVSPVKLCEYYAQNCEVYLNRRINDLNEVEADAVVIASGTTADEFAGMEFLSLEKVRGQITYLKASPVSQSLKCNILYGGYLSAAKDGEHVAGATFEKWIEHNEVSEDNHLKNIHLLKENISSLATENFPVVGGRTGFRATTNDRFPVIGSVPEIKNIYISAAYGSHGLIGALSGAHYLVDMLRNGPKSFSKETVKVLNPTRFKERKLRKNIKF